MMNDKVRKNENELVRKENFAFFSSLSLLYLFNELLVKSPTKLNPLLSLLPLGEFLLVQNCQNFNSIA